MSAKQETTIHIWVPGPVGESWDGQVGLQAGSLLATDQLPDRPLFLSPCSPPPGENRTMHDRRVAEQESTVKVCKRQPGRWHNG